MQNKLLSAFGAVALLMNVAHAPTTQANTTSAPNLITQANPTKTASPQAVCNQSQSSVPVPAGVQTRTILPATTNPVITGEPDCPHYVALSQTAQRQPELFVFLPGTNGEPLKYQMIVNQAAANGYFAIGLAYQNLISENEACSKPLNELPEDPQCPTDFRQEVVTGVDTTSVVTVTATNSIVFRLRSLIQYLDAQQPNQGWGQFVQSSGELAWSKIRWGGHSQGSGHTGYIATRREVTRACLFGGPADGSRYGLTAPPSGISGTIPISTPNGIRDFYFQPPTWVLTPTAATPARRLFAFAHQRDFEPYKQLNWDLLGISDIGGIANVDADLPPYGGAHALTTTLPVSNPHGSVVVDDETPRAANGLPIYAPVWQQMCFGNLPNPEPDPLPCQDQCRDLGDAPDSNNSLGNIMSIHPFGLVAQQANFPTEYTGAAGTGPIHLNAGSNLNPNGVPFTAIDSALGLDVNAAGNFFSRVSNERNAFLIPDQDARKRNIIPAPIPANGRSNRDGFDNAFISPAGAPLLLRFSACQPTVLQYAQYIHGPWAMNGFYTGTRFINVWGDFNRDGDWADSNLGAACPEFPNASVDEWFVRNFPAPNASGVFVLPPQLFPNNTSTRPFWLRISISDSPAPANSIGNGPAAGYRFGETEDHLLCYNPQMGLWADCPMARLKLNNNEDELDGEFSAKPRENVTLTLELDDLTPVFPITVTWSIYTETGTTAGNKLDLKPEATPRKVVNVLTNKTLDTLNTTLGWYGCITCTLRPEGGEAVAAPPPYSLQLINVHTVDAAGNETTNDIKINVGTRVFLPVLQR
jgi:hypothetical protein